MRIVFFLFLLLLSFGRSFHIFAQQEPTQEVTESEEKEVTGDVTEAPAEQEETVEGETTEDETVNEQVTEVATEDGGATQEATDQEQPEETVTEEVSEVTEAPESPEEDTVEETAIQTEQEAEVPTEGRADETVQESESQQIEQPEEEPDVTEIKGIDTLDIDEPKGNWLLKRIWWEKAERWYEKIKQVKQEILESRMFFFKKRSELDRNTFDPFYIKIGVGQGELQEIISSLLAMLEKTREERGSLDEKQREFLVALELEQENLKNLEQKLKAVNAIDNGIDDAILKLMEQINRAREYERQAWDTFKTITRELSDKRARELYYSMDGMWKNVRAISMYIKDQFTPYFNQMVEKAQGLISEMETTITALKEKGIDLKAQAQKLTKKEADGKDQQLEKQKEKSDQKKVKEKASGGLFGWFFDLLTMIADGFSAMWDYIISFFVSAPSVPQDNNSN